MKNLTLAVLLGSVGTSWSAPKTMKFVRDSWYNEITPFSLSSVFNINKKELL